VCSDPFLERYCSLFRMLVFCVQNACSCVRTGVMCSGSVPTRTLGRVLAMKQIENAHIAHTENNSVLRYWEHPKLDVKNAQQRRVF